MDEEALARAFEKFQAGVDLTEQDFKKLGRGTSEFGKNLVQAGLDVSKTFGKFAQGLAEGETGFKQLNPVIDGMIGGLTDLTKNLPFVSGAIKLVGEGAKFLVGQLQVATESFQEISKIGGLTAKGMSGLREQFLKSGQTLQGFQKTVSANSQALAMFRGTVGSGAEDFSRIVGGIVDSNLGDELRRIGYTADEIGEATAGYIAQQTRLGYAQNKTQAQLIAGSKQYADELDILARLTGQSREALQKQQDAALSEGRFRATLDTMNEGTAKALLDFQSRINAVSPEVAQGIRDITSGFTNSDAAIKLFNSTAGEAGNIIERLKNNEISQDEATRQLQQAIKGNIETNRAYTQAVGDGTNTFIKYNQASDFARAELIDGQLRAKKAQSEAQAGTDDLTNQTVDAQKSLEQMGRNLNNMAFQALPMASKAVSAFADVLNKAVAGISKELGIKPAAGGAATAAPSAGAPAGGGGGVFGAIGRGLTAMGLGPGAGTAAAGMSQQDLASQGLKIKAGDVQAEGSTINPKLIEYAKRIQSEVPGFQYFSGFNDRYHQENSPSSSHTKGLAADFTVSPTPSPEQGRTIANQLKAMGFATVIDEYNNPSAKATAGHFHAAISARNGFEGLISGPKSGYRPNIEMHGDERVSIKPASVSGAMDMDRFSNTMGEQMGVMGAQLSALENLVAIMRDQTTISTKILQASNN
jgi:hypothetical protein